MSNPVSLTSADVQRLAGSHRVRQETGYHARHHHEKWEDVVYALQTCFYVAKDQRPAFAKGYVAFGHASRTKKLRIDFNLGHDEQGNVILVVSAWEHKR